MNKWQLNRAGLVNFWYYQDQEFEFSDGKILLRGSNGSGKSLTMQSLFPVLLDGVTAANRLDSFGSRSRKMEDYLLGEKNVSERDEGIGYLYLELKREGRDEFLTCGIGLSARRGAGNLTKWYFSLEDNSRINRDFWLYEKLSDHELRPLTKKKLANRLENRGKLFEKQGQYKTYMNQHVFGFDSIGQFDELIDLLINLRSPKLSKEFRPTVIYEILRDSLPQLKEDELLPLAQTIEQLDAHRERIQELVIEQNELQNLGRRYQIFHDEVTGQIGGKWTLLTKQKKAQTEQQKNLALQLTDLEEQFAAIDADLYQVKSDLLVATQKEESLSHHEGFVIAKRGQELQERLEKLQQSYSRTEAQLEEKNRQLAELQKDFEEYQGKVTESFQDLEDYLTDNQQYLETLRFHELDSRYSKKIRETISTAEYRYWQDEVRKKIRHIDTILDQLKEFRLIKGKLTQLEKEYGKQIQNIDGLKRDLKQWETTFQEELDKWKMALDIWEETAPVQVAPEEMNQVIYLMEQIFEEDCLSEEVLAPIREAYQRTLAHNQEETIPLEQSAHQLEEETVMLDSQIAEWEQAKMPEPGRSEGRKEHREKLLGGEDSWTAFYEAVDFKEDVTEELRNHLEGALYSSGILDAVIAHDRLTMEDDVQILPAPHFFTETLANYLTVNSLLAPKLQELTTDILQSILIDGDAAEAPCIFRNGSYKIANLTGEMAPCYQASYIGAASQERYRQQQIAMQKLSAKGLKMCGKQKKTP